MFPATVELTTTWADASQHERGWAFECDGAHSDGLLGGTPPFRRLRRMRAPAQRLPQLRLGFHNTGNTCHLAATLQGFLALPDFPGLVLHSTCHLGCPKPCALRALSNSEASTRIGEHCAPCLDSWAPIFAIVEDVVGRHERRGRRLRSDH